MLMVNRFCSCLWRMDKVKDALDKGVKNVTTESKQN
jgi:hypothetical protein